MTNDTQNDTTDKREAYITVTEGDDLTIARFHDWDITTTGSTVGQALLALGQKVRYVERGVDDPGRVWPHDSGGPSDDPTREGST